MPKKPPAKKSDDTDWSEEPEGELGPEDLSDEEVAALETEAGEEAGEEEREEAGEEEREARGEEFEDDSPQNLDEARDRIRDLEDLRHREKRSLRRTIKDLRGERRQRRLETVAPQGEPEPKVELPENIEFELDESGKPVLPREKFQQYVKAAGQQPGAPDRAAIRRQLEQARDQAQGRYTEIREEYLDDAEDPDVAEETIEHLEGAYQWLNRQVLEELRGGGPAPRSREDLYELIEDAGLDEDFEDRYPGVTLKELLGAASGNRRKFARLVDRQLEDLEGEGEGKSRRPRRRRRSRERDDEEEDDTRRRRSRARRSERGSARVGLRKSSRRSMRRRGATGARPEGAPSLERYGSMDVEDFLDLPTEEIAKVERMAGRPPRKRRR